MKLIISKTTLQNALNMVRPCASASRILPIGEYAKIDGKDGKLVLFSTDFESKIVHMINYDGEAVSFLMPVAWFIEFLKELPEQPISIQVDGLILKISTTLNGEYEIPTDNVADFPKLPESTAALFNISATDLKAPLFAVSDNDLMPQLTGVAISEKTIRGCNSNILYSKAHTGYTGSEIMFSKKITSLLPDGDYAVSISTNQVCFSTESTAYHTVLVDCKIPDYDNVIPESCPIQFSVDRVSLLSSLKRLKLFANQVKQSVRFDFTRNGIALSAADVDLAKTGKEVIAGQLHGEDISIGFNGLFFQSCLSNMDCETVYINMSTPNRAAIIRDNDTATDKENLILIMPCVL